MGKRAPSIFPFAIAIVLPPAGFIIGLSQFEENRELAIRLMIVAVLAAVVWALLLLG